MKTWPIHILYNSPNDAFMDSIQGFNPALTAEYLNRWAEPLLLLTYKPRRTLSDKEREIVKNRLYAMLLAIMPTRKHMADMRTLRYSDSLLEQIVNQALTRNIIWIDTPDNSPYRDIPLPKKP